MPNAPLSEIPPVAAAPSQERGLGKKDQMEKKIETNMGTRSQKGLIRLILNSCMTLVYCSTIIPRV